MLKIFNPQDIWAWVDGDVEHRARYIAHLVPTIFKEREGFARELLIKYGYRKDVSSYLSDACFYKGYQFDRPLEEFQKIETEANIQIWLDEFMKRLNMIEENQRIAYEREYL